MTVHSPFGESRGSAMNKPLVSVVVPTYNSKGLVVETIRSALANSVRDLEVIVINDGSTDSTALEIASLGDDRIVLINQTNRGIGATRNRGLASARGEYIALLDHDDLWDPSYLANQIRFLHTNPEVGVAISQWDCISDEAELGLGSQVEVGPMPDVLGRLAKGEITIMSACVVIRASALGGVRYTEDRGVMEDVPFYLELFQSTLVGVSTTVPLMHYRRHQNNTSGDAHYFQSGAAKVIEMQQSGLLRTRDAQQYAAFICRQACRKLVEQGYKRDAWKTYRQSMQVQARLGRWKFLLGMPPEIVFGGSSIRG